MTIDTDPQAFLAERQLRTLLRRQQNLFELSLRDVDLSQLCPHLSGIIDTTFAVVNFWGHLVFNNTGLDDWIVVQKWPWRDRPQTVMAGNTPLRRFSLVHRDNRVGNILFRAKSRIDASGGDVLLPQAAKIVARALVRSPDLPLVKALPSTVDDLVRLYLDERLSLDSFVESCIKADAPLPNADYQCLLFLRRDMSNTSLADEDKNRLLDRLNLFIELPSDNGLWCSTEGGMLLILPVPPRLRATAINGVVTEWAAGLHSRNGLSLCAAISDRKNSLRELRDAYLEVRAVARVIAGLGVETHVGAYKDFEFTLLFDDVSRERMLRFTRNVFKGLTTSGGSKEAKLMVSLELFILNECNIAIAAQALGVHKNTLSYRLDRAAELLDIDLRHTDDLLRLKLAFILRKIIRRTELASGGDPLAS